MKFAEIIISVITSLCWQTEWKDDFTHLTIQTSQEFQEGVYIVRTKTQKGEVNLYFSSPYAINEFSVMVEEGKYLTRFTKNSAYIYEKKFDIIIPKECFDK